MKRSRKRMLKRVALIATYGFFGSLIFMRFLRGQPIIEDGDVLTAVLVALLLSTSVQIDEGLLLPRTRRLRLIPAVLIRAASLTVTSVGSVFFGVFFANVIQDGLGKALLRFRQLVESGEVASGSAYALVIFSIFVFFSSVSHKLGPGVLGNWLLGRYHEPREEHCVFMFLDIRNSTGVAERLGNFRFSALIRDVFSDITPPLLDHDARVSHFIGDEVVLYWPIQKGGSPDASFARCFIAIQELMVKLGPRYQESYGIVPQLKAGAHYGSVVVTDVGEIKSEIVFHGDVLNVTSRLERLCSEELADLLISGELANAIANEPCLELDDCGDRVLKGREHMIRVFSVVARKTQG